MSESIVLLSGGQDSTTCLAWAEENLGHGIRTVSFAYGQKHAVELEVSERLSNLMPGVLSHVVLPIEALSTIGGTALTNPHVQVEEIASARSHNVHAYRHGLPSTFVPGRNMLFLTLAAAYGARFGVYQLVTGVCQQDRSGYPDCRGEFIEAAQEAISLALAEPVVIHTPLIDKTKAETWALAEELGITDLIINETHTCYNGNRDLNTWGHGCGECPACVERSKGYWEWKDRAENYA